ncbi:hypothetical protein BDW74DRAFT_181480 [Aspergillus multicolor]|uniref:uncharacterized protein n=1 Tax=Aspergillus multicolor TaxID=41759 RepID=UPI003CCD03E5
MRREFGVLSYTTALACSLFEPVRQPDHLGRASSWSLCKQALVLSDYYPVFNERHVELVTDSITAFDEAGVVTQDLDGKERHHDVDVLIWATGYKGEEFGVAVPTRGRKGHLLAAKYKPDMFSLYGVAVDDFPNLFNLLGPNSLGFDIHIVDLLELQAPYIAQVVKYLRDKQNKAPPGCRYAVMAHAERVQDWTLSLREGQARHPAAAASCRSHYKSKDGKVYFYPYGYARYKKLVSRVDLCRDWRLISRVQRQEGSIVEEIAASDCA